MSNQLTNFNYHGLDDAQKSSVLKRNLEKLENELRKRYIKRLELFNKQNLEHNPEPFRFLKKENCSILALITPVEFNNSVCCEIFFLSTPNKRVVETLVLDSEDLSDLDSFNPTNKFFTDKILPRKGFDESQIIVSSTEYYNSLQYDHSVFSNSFNVDRGIKALALNDFIIQTIKSETQQFKEVNQTPLKYFAKYAYKFPFSLIDLKPLVALVNDDDFSYQLDQAMAAYHQNLFLPCAATLGVVLETLCIRILEDNGVNRIKSGDTQLGKLKERLINERIITRRDNTRLEVAYKMRNMASHSNPGVALKEDCHFMLNVINTMAFEYLNQDD